MIDDDKRAARRQRTAETKRRRREAERSFVPLVYEGDEPVTIPADEWRQLLEHFNALGPICRQIAARLAEEEPE